MTQGVGRAASYNPRSLFFHPSNSDISCVVVDPGASARLHPRGGRFLLIGSLKREPNLRFGRDFSATARERSEYA